MATAQSKGNEAQKISRSNEMAIMEPALTTTPQRRATRWRLIPVTLLIFIGLGNLLISVMFASVAIFFNIRDGWIVPTPDTPTRNQLAFTPANITFVQLMFWAGVVAIASAIAFFRGRWRLAWGAFALWLAIAECTEYFAPPR